MRGHPYRFPGKPQGTYSGAHGSDAVWVFEIYGDYYGTVERVIPIDEYRKTHRLAPQDLVVRTKLVYYQYPDGRIVGRYERA